MARRNLASETLSRYTRMRNAGAPTIVTADEAWRMTAGQLGKRGDAGSFGGISLSRIAKLCVEAVSLTEQRGEVTPLGGGFYRSELDNGSTGEFASEAAAYADLNHRSLVLAQSTDRTRVQA